MHRPQRIDGLLQTDGERVIGTKHAGEDRIATLCGCFMREQYRPQRRRNVIAVVAVPAVADIGFVFGLLAYFCNLGMPIDGREESIDVDRAERLGEGNVLVGGQGLVTEE